MTTRERRQAKADRLREWAAKRQEKAAATFKDHEKYRGDHAFNTQPGRIPERTRINRAEEREFRSLNKADSMENRADGIERQLDRAIYDDDPDARERLAERIAGLEEQRDRKKAINAEARKHKQDLATFQEWISTQDAVTQSAIGGALEMYNGNMKWAKYDLTNLGSEIRRYKQRLQGLDQPKPDRIITVKYSGTCETCNTAIERGEQARYRKGEGLRCLSACAS